MNLDREALQDLLEEYALDLTAPATAAAVEASLPAHPDLQTQVAALRDTLAAFGHHAAEQPPPSLLPRIMAEALRTRAAGRGVDTPPPAAPAAAYRSVCMVLRDLLAGLSPQEWHATTTYGVPVHELVAHLLAMEDYCGDRLGLWKSSVDPAVGHVALRPATAPDHPAALRSTWWQQATAIATSCDALSDAELATAVEVHGTVSPIRTLLLVRTFEVWAHAEDIARATARPLPLIDAAVLHAMADAACGLLAAALEGSARHRGKGFRVTLTGPGGGSWAHTLDGSTLAATSSMDATLVADTVDFCRLFADRISPEDVGDHRIGDAALLEDLLVTATTFADFGDPAGTN